MCCGMILDCFKDICDIYKDVVKVIKDQIECEQIILEVYWDFCGVLKQVEVIVLELFNIVMGKFDVVKVVLEGVLVEVEVYIGDDVVQKVRLELVCDEQLWEMQDEEKCYQIVKDFFDNFMVGYNMFEVIMVCFVQIINVKEWVYV